LNHFYWLEVLDALSDSLGGASRCDGAVPVRVEVAVSAMDPVVAM